VKGGTANGSIRDELGTAESIDGTPVCTNSDCYRRPGRSKCCHSYSQVAGEDKDDGEAGLTLWLTEIKSGLLRCVDLSPLEFILELLVVGLLEKHSRKELVVAGIQIPRL
jgi:hypothetical protein